jgi:hypothetical protein
MDATRWDRLAADLRAAGFDVRVDARPYTESVRGRARHGTSYSITYRVRGKGLVSIHDGRWSKNPDVWTGYQVSAEDADSITIGRPRFGLKKRSETVATFRLALANVEG